MDVQSSNLEYYDKMQQLEERLKRSEEERMLLQRQFDLLLQSNQEKERARVSVVEARYKRFLDEDKRRRDRNSNLLQALNRIDSHTASLAAKTERMRALRKHYEAFIADSYPGWQMGLERSLCPLAAIAPAPSAMTRVTDITGYDTENPQCFPDPSDYSETQYHPLPSITSKPFYPLATPLCRSDLAISSQEDCPVVGRSPYRTGSSAIRSASLSPSRVRDLSSQYDANKITSLPLRNYDLYSPSKSPDVGFSSRLRNESSFLTRQDRLPSPRQSRYPTNFTRNFGEENQIPYKPPSSTNQRFLDYDIGNSEADQNTSGDLLNLSNLSLSDDGVLNEHDSPPPYSAASHPTFTSPRDYSLTKKISPPASVRHHTSPREVFIPKRSASLSPSVFTSSSPKSILSPRSRKSDIPSSLPLSDSVHRNLLPAEDFDQHRSDTYLSPRRQKLTWQTLRPSYLPPPPRTSIRRSVTFTEPEYESPYIFRDEDVSPYSGSLRRQSPSLPVSSWESSDHERFLREKQGREKDAFREKIERLKELIQENKEQEMDIAGSVHDSVGKGISSPSMKRDYDQYKKTPSKDYSTDKDWKLSQSRRSSLATELSSDTEDDVSQAIREKVSKKVNKDVEYKKQFDCKHDEELDTISDKEHWSGKFNEKDEDVKEKSKDSELEHILRKEKLDGLHPVAKNQNCEETYDYTPIMPTKSEEEKASIRESLSSQNEQEFQRESNQSIFGSHSDQEHAINGSPQNEPSSTSGKESLDFIYSESQQQQNPIADNTFKEQTSQELVNFDFKSEEPRQNEQNSNHQNDQQLIRKEEERFSEHSNSFNYEGDQMQHEWTTNEEGGSQVPQPDLQYNYGQSDSTPAGYEERSQNSPSQMSEKVEPYSTDGEHDQHSYENYESNTNQPAQVQENYESNADQVKQQENYESNADQQVKQQENYGEVVGYESYQEPQQVTDPASGYQDYSEDPNQYQQNYQTYPEDQQYGDQQDQAYSTQDQSSYYPQEPNKNQYEYEGQEYNYQQDQEAYNYPQDPNYQQDQAYQQDQPYQPDQTYLQDPNYSQDQQYPQSTDYQQGEQYEETGYAEPQQYEGYQTGADATDLSEDTTPSADTNYLAQPQGSEGTNQQQTLDQYRAVLGADPSSEPAYSDSSEIENQMAAVVGQGGNSTASVPEQTPPASTPPTPQAAAKGKAAAKKRPQLTRKQSSITAENTEGNKQQQSPSLPKTPESKSEPAAPQQLSDSDFDISSH